jgi:hypothetical protein
VLTDKVNALLYDTPEEAVQLVRWLQTDTNARRQLGANAQMWAAWQDLSLSAGKLKRLLKMIGA